MGKHYLLTRCLSHPRYYKYQQFTSMLKGSLPPYSYLLWEGSIVMSLFASSLSARSAVMACQERVYRAAGENGQVYVELTWLVRATLVCKISCQGLSRKGLPCCWGRMVKSVELTWLTWLVRATLVCKINASKLISFFSFRSFFFVSCRLWDYFMFIWNA